MSEHPSQLHSNCKDLARSSRSKSTYINIAESSPLTYYRLSPLEISVQNTENPNCKSHLEILYVGAAKCIFEQPARVYQQYLCQVKFLLAENL